MENSPFTFSVFFNNNQENIAKLYVSILELYLSWVLYVEKLENKQHSMLENPYKKYNLIHKYD